MDLLLDPSAGETPDPKDPVDAYLESLYLGYQYPLDPYSLLPISEVTAENSDSIFMVVDDAAQEAITQPEPATPSSSHMLFTDMVITEDQAEGCLGPVLHCPSDNSFASADDVWHEMTVLQTEDTSARDGERTYYNQFTAGVTYLGRGMLDLGMTGQNVPMQRWGSALRTGSAYFTQGIDISADYDQYAALEEQCGMMSTEECEAQKSYILWDGAMTLASSTNGTLNLASDFALASAPQLANQLSFVALPAYVVSLAAGVKSSVEVLAYEFTKPKANRDDIKINRAFATLTGTSSALVSTLYRFGLVGFDMTGTNALSPTQRADLIRGRLMGSVAGNADYGYYKLTGNVLGAISAIIVMYLAWDHYGESLQEAYHNDDDLRFRYEFLGLASTLSKGLASSALNVPGLIPHACALYIVGCFISVYQILYLENGGEDKYSPAYSDAQSMTAPLLALMAEKRESCGLESNPISNATTFEAWRDLLVIAGVDGKNRDSSLLDRPSLQVIVRASAVHTVGTTLHAKGASEEDKLKFLARIVGESMVDPQRFPNTFDPKHDPDDDLWHAIKSEYFLDGYIRYDLELRRGFLTQDSLAQAAYLVFLEQSGILTEDYWGEELWNSNPALLAMRVRLEKSDAQFLRENVFYHNEKATPLVLVYLRGRSPESAELWQEHPEQMQAILAGMSLELGLSGVGEELDAMQKQMAYYWEANKPAPAPEPSEEQIEELLSKIYDNSQIISANLPTPSFTSATLSGGG